MIKGVKNILIYIMQGVVVVAVILAIALAVNR